MKLPNSVTIPLQVQQNASVAVLCLIVQGNTHDDVLLLVTSLLRVVVKTVITMDRSLSVVVSKNVS